jgi:hypothetical protein
MAAPGYADANTLYGTAVPKVGNPLGQRSVFGDAVLLIFLLAQCLDGVFTYVGVVSFGLGVEANPLIAAMMAHVGHGPALVGAKSLAGLLGIALHVCRMHGAVAALSVFYLAVAVLPWITILFSW